MNTNFIWASMRAAAAKKAKSLNIKAESNTTVSGYSVPNLTVDDVLRAYNTIVSGGVCVISDSTDNSHFVVNQADTVGDEISIEIIYFNYMLVTYGSDGSTVTITHKALT